MENIRIALDWTPNANHIGILIAKNKGFYESRGLDVTVLNPQEDDYAVTPAKKVEKGEADLALCPTESLLSYRTKADPYPLIALAAVLQEDLSAIAVLNYHKIKSPKELDGHTYASYNAKYEDSIVKQMIKNDGGRGDITIEYPQKLGIWDALLKQGYDSTWIFLNWEGVEADSKGVDYTAFKMADYSIPYSYSPVIAGNEIFISERKKAFKDFIAATSEGYHFAKDNTEEAAEILKGLVEDRYKDVDLEETIRRTVAGAFKDGEWGQMEKKVIEKFIDWIYMKGFESEPIEPSNLYTNEYISG
jgi:ABC-type nitrate/sulfonate/bicarbonate transport system substrate-binding protein